MPPNRNSKSGGQSQGPKQTAGGGASRSSKSQATNKPRSSGSGNAAHPQMMGNGSSRSSASSAAAPRPRQPQTQPQPQATAHRPSNGTKHSNATNVAPAPRPQVQAQAQAQATAHRPSNGPKQPNTNNTRVAAPKPAQPPSQATAHRPSNSNGTKHSNASNAVAPKSQGANGSNIIRASQPSGEANSGNRVFRDRTVNQAQRNALNNGTQRVQGYSPQPNISSKNQPKPKHSPVLSGNSPGHSLASSSNSASRPSPPRPGNVQHAHIATVAHGAIISGNKVSPGPSPSTQSRHPQPQAPKTQQHGPTPRKGPEPILFPASLAYTQHSGGKSTDRNTFPKVHVPTPHRQHPARGNRSSAPAARKASPKAQVSKSVRNGSQNVPNRSKNLAPQNLPKKEKQQAPNRGPGHSSSLSKKTERVKRLNGASSRPGSSSKRILLRQRAPAMIWRASDRRRVVSAYSTLTAAPLPSPPKNELQNKVTRKTISQNRGLFKVVSPIKVGVFKKYTKDHPNQPFVRSVARGLKKGFWPWADTSDPKFPTTHDGSRRLGARIVNKQKAKFVRQQRNEEMKLGRWSKAFGRRLLPGMHAAPINVVAKSTPGQFRLIVDQSRGRHSLNSTIAKYQVKVRLDTIHDLGKELLAVREKHPKRKIVLFKSDVKSAYRQVPMHPLWQIKQAIPVDGQYHIDRCNTFGNRGGGWNWDSVISTVNWIAAKKKRISVLGYVDDIFGWEFARNKKFYKPYKRFMPTKQARLLELWDELGIPHDEEKQLSGPSLPILGFHVDANRMSVRIPDKKKANVVDILRSNAHAGKPYTMNELQSMAGYVGSALSLYPRLRPRLRVLFDEMSAQEGGTTKLRVTSPVARTLSSLADFLEHAPPVAIRYKKERMRRLGAGISKK